MFIASAISSLTMFTTNSPQARMFRAVSLGPSGRFSIDTASVGGLPVTPMKKENGATLKDPSAPTVDTNAMGRGTRALIMSL